MNSSYDLDIGSKNYVKSSIGIAFIIFAIVTLIIVSLLLSNSRNLAPILNGSNVTNASNVSSVNMSSKPKINPNNTVAVKISDNCSCTNSYNPVKCYKNGIKRDFYNYCFAYCKGFRNCTKILPVPPLNTSQTKDNISNSSNNSSNCVCTMEYNPVKCIKNGVTKTFPNLCEANCNGYYMCSASSNNPEVVTPTPSNHECICPAYYAPVVCVKNGISRSFSNICFAHCLGFNDCSAESS